MTHPFAQFFARYPPDVICATHPCDDVSVMAGAGRVLGNGALARAQLSFGAAFTAEWAFTVGIGLVAFADGGATAVAVVGVLRLLPAAVLAPTLAAYADRVPRERVLFLSSSVRGAATLACAPVLFADWPVEIVYGLAALSTIAFTPYRASHSALLPSLCRTPDELTKVNVVRGALDGLSVVTGPFVAALLVNLGEVANVFVFAGAMGLVSAVLVMALRYERMVPEVEPRTSFIGDLRSGFSAVSRNVGVSLTFWMVILQAVIRGAFTVLVVVVAIDLLSGEEADVGLLQGAVGIGALVGSGLCTRLIGSRAMARWLGIAVVLWGVPLAVMGAVPLFGVALLAAATIGVGNALVDVTAFTMLARLAPDAVLGRVFGLLESVGAIAVASGGLVVPPLISLLGVEGALIAVGLVAPFVVTVVWSRLKKIDGGLTVRTDAIALIREVPMLRPLPVPVLEQLAVHMERVELAPGERVFEAGEPGDQFYVVESGTVQVLDDGRVVRSMGRGAGFGEIALLSDSVRTMTVVATDDVVLRGIRRCAFVPAIRSFGVQPPLQTRCARDTWPKRRGGLLRDPTWSERGAAELMACGAVSSASFEHPDFRLPQGMTPLAFSPVAADALSDAGSGQLILAAVLGIATVVVLIVWAKFHPFLALMLGTAVLGAVAAVAPLDVVDSFTAGLGTTFGTVGLLIALGAMLGKLLADSQGANAIVDRIVSNVGPKRLPWAMALIAAIIGLPCSSRSGW